MKNVEINKLKNLIYSSKYSDAYGLIKNNIELFRKDDEESVDDIFNREILNYFKIIRIREDYLDDYKTALLNINFFNKEVAFYLLDSGINLETLIDPIFICTSKYLDRLVCNANNKEVIEKLLSLPEDKENLRLYNDGVKTLTSTGAYLQINAIFEGRLEAFKRIRRLNKSEITESIINRFKEDKYCLLNEKERNYVHYFHNIVLDVDKYIEDNNQKKDFITMLLYSTNCPFIEQETLPIIKNILGDYLYDAYKSHLEEEIENGTKFFIKVTDYKGNPKSGERNYSLMEKATSFALNVSAEDIKKYIKTKEVK